MCIVVSDQCIEYHVVEQTQRLRRALARDAAYQLKALRDIRAALVLIFHFGHHAQRLAEIFLMQPLQAPRCIESSVIAFDQQKPAIPN